MQTRRNFLQLSLATVGICKAQGDITCGAAMSGAELYVPPPATPQPRVRLKGFIGSPAWKTFFQANQVLKTQGRFQNFGTWHRTCCSYAASPDIHSTFHFLPWHRIAVHLYERALCAASNDPNLRVPYWEWQSDYGVPKEYNETSGMEAVNSAGNVVSRTSGLEATSWRSDLLQTDGLLQINDFSSFSKLSAQQSHTLVHSYSGPIMADIQNSAGDPLFYVHHANMDRLWFQWKMKHPGPCPLGIAKKKIYFSDLDGSPKFTTINAIWDEMALGYTYSGQNAPLILLGQAPAPTENSNAAAKRFVRFKDLNLTEFDLGHESSFFSIHDAQGTPVAQLALGPAHDHQKVSIVAPMSEAGLSAGKGKLKIARTSASFEPLSNLKSLRVARIAPLSPNPDH